jgi:thioredoxin-like negative regulator of GroEL
VAQEAPSDVLFVRVDTDENPELAREWDVQGIPCMVRIEEGQEVARLIGYRPESDIKRFAFDMS